MKKGYSKNRHFSKGKRTKLNTKAKSICQPHKDKADENNENLQVAKETLKCSKRMLFLQMVDFALRILIRIICPF